MELANTITRENLEILMRLFYEKALLDDEIGTFFELELGSDTSNGEWTEHIDLLVDFWASQFLGEEQYKGDPFGPHFTIIGLEEKDFNRWVELFSESSDNVYTPDISHLFKEKGVHYSKAFMQALNENKNSKDLKNLKSKIGWE